MCGVDGTNLGQTRSDRQYHLSVIQYRTKSQPLLLNIKPYKRMIQHMKHLFIPLCTAASLLLASPVLANDCFADYKAKQDNPLRLHYGVAKINGSCSAPAARSELTGRLAAKGWTLLSVLSTFSTDGLAERKQSAGSYYLRF